jgi:hypothetical protein
MAIARVVACIADDGRGQLLRAHGFFRPSRGEQGSPKSPNWRKDTWSLGFVAVFEELLQTFINQIETWANQSVVVRDTTLMLPSSALEAWWTSGTNYTFN